MGNRGRKNLVYKKCGKSALTVFMRIFQSGLNQRVSISDVLPTLKEFRQDKYRVILTADKGVAMVVLDQQDYINKAQDLLVERNTCRLLTDAPTNKHRNKLINMLRPIKAEGALWTLHKDSI